MLAPNDVNPSIFCGIPCGWQGGRWHVTKPVSKRKKNNVFNWFPVFVSVDWVELLKFHAKLIALINPWSDFFSPCAISFLLMQRLTQNSNGMWRKEEWEKCEEVTKNLVKMHTTKMEKKDFPFDVAAMKMFFLYFLSVTFFFVLLLAVLSVTALEVQSR